MSRLVSVDLETTGLDPERHEAWEVALVFEDGQWACWHFPLKALHNAQPTALEVGRFYARYSYPRVNDAHLRGADRVYNPQKYRHQIYEARLAARRIAELTAGKTLMGLNVGSFDQLFLAKLLWSWGVAPAWAHRYMELGSYAAAKLNRTHPASGSALAELVPNDNAHDALADAEWNWEAYRYLKELP